MKKLVQILKYNFWILLILNLGFCVSIKEVKAGVSPFYVECKSGIVNVNVPYAQGYEVRCNGGDWTDDCQNFHLNPGDKLEIRYKTGTKSNAVTKADIKIDKEGETGTVSLGGDILTLLNSDGEVDELPDGCFNDLFENNTYIVDASNLVVRKVGNNSCANMFKGCTSLTKAPQLPAKTLEASCYQSMFEGCISLEELHVSFLSLKDVSAPLSNWLEGAGVNAQSCTFYCPQALIDEANANGGIELYLGIPDNWNVVAENPKHKDNPEIGFESNYIQYLLKLLNGENTNEEPEKVIVDRDKFKSEAPAHTVIASEANTDDYGLFDLKIHKTDEKTEANHELLVKTLLGNDLSILMTQNIYPRRDLSTTENGSLKKLTWNNLPKNQSGPVFALIYNETDGAYIINGTLDANGTAVFNNFKLRSASTVTICR